MSIFKKKLKAGNGVPFSFDENPVISLTEFRLPVKGSTTETRLLQYNVMAVSDGAKPMRVGYTELHLGASFAPLVWYPQELWEKTAAKLDKLKEELQRESARETEVQTVSP